MRKGAFIFVVGGARSGKSGHALSLALAHEDLEKVFIATAQAFDAEMSARIDAHRFERGDLWKTIEEPLEVARAVESLGPGKVIVVDCLTLWLSNLIHSEKDDSKIKEEIAALAKAFCDAPSVVIGVSNEVGLGLVPENALARRFRDLSGIMNQAMASKAYEAWFIAAGLPLKLK